jgi:integrase/recombinase XerD
MNMSAWRARFEQYMAVRHWSRRTIEAYGGELVRFFPFLETQGVYTVANISREVMEAYRTHLFYTTWRGGQRLVASTQARGLSAVKAFVRFLTLEQYLLLDPGERLELPRLPRILPRLLLTETEVEALLESPDVTTPLGIRDRAVMEVLYASGIRNTETRDLTPDDVHLERQELMIRYGKGRKSRVVPLGDEATYWLSHWLTEGRPRLTQGRIIPALFVTWRGRPLTRENMADLVSRCGDRAGLPHRVTPHVLRHACATHMLARGAGLRHLQELLGHDSPATTQRYTHIELSDLHEVHRRYHPREVHA